MSIIPENTPDLTLWTDPVTQWALRSIAFGVGCGLCVLIGVLL